MPWTRRVHYKLITSKDSPPTAKCQCNNFSKMIKSKKDGYVYTESYSGTYNKYIYKYKLMNSIAKAACIPLGTIIDIHFYSKIYYDEYKNYTSAKYNDSYDFDNDPYEFDNDSYDFDDDCCDFDERLYYYERKIYYAYVDLSKDSVFNNINKTQLEEEYNKKCLENEVRDLEKRYNNLQSDNKKEISKLNNENYNLKQRLDNEKKEMNKKNRKLEKNIQTLEEQNRNMKDQYENLKTENQTNKNQLDNLTVQHNNLKKKQEEEENKKMEKKKNLENYKKAFKKDKEVIENNNIKNAKNYIINFIINYFVKTFEKPDNKKDGITQSLLNFMSKFTQEYMTYCNPFIDSFRKHSHKIINEYQVNENKLSIEHINFIVIGRAGIGKSAFINESLLLSGNQRAKEGKGTSVTEKSTLYCSKKLKMIRMWDTQGLDYKITQAYILNEIKRLVDEGLKKGPDHYINIILYCTQGFRFQEEDGQLIKEIMQLYPLDNLPVIITQLQSYFQNDAIEMEKTIREILQNYLEYKIVKKIEIASIVARDKIVENTIFKARGIPDLLRSSFDIMGRAIDSATSKKYSQDIENLCKNFVDKKIDYLKNQSKDEMEVLDISKDYYMNQSEKYFKTEEKPHRTLSNDNFYSKMTEKSYFMTNFIQGMTHKFINIYNNLNNTNYSIESKEPLIMIFINQRLEKLKIMLNDLSQKIFDNIYDKIYQKYFTDLRKQQSIRSKEFHTSNQIIDEDDIEKRFKKELNDFFKNEFFKYFFCIIIKLFMDNLKNILIDNYQKELKTNEEMTKIINDKAEKSLKFITQHLKEKLLKDLEKYFPKAEETDGNVVDDIKNNFKFEY